MHQALQDLSFKKISRLVLDFDALILLTLIWFMIQYLRFVFPPLFETLQVEYSISTTEVGFMYSVLLFGYASMQFPGGYLSDRFNEWSVITSGIIIFSIGLLLVFLSQPFWSLVLAAGLIGVGTGVHKIVAINLIHHLYSERTGLSIGFMDSVGIFGGVFAPLTIVVVFNISISWRLIFSMGFFICAILAYSFYHVSKQYTREMGEFITSDKKSTTGFSYFELFQYYHFSAFVAISTTFVFVWTGITAFYPLYLSNVSSFSGSVAGILYGLLFALSLSQTVTGGLSDRYNRITMSLIMYVLMSVSLFAFIFSSSLVTVVLSTMLIGIGFHGFRPIRDAYLMDIIPKEIGGGVLGLVRTVMTAVGATSPLVIGATADAFGLRYAFTLLLGITGFGVVLVVTIMIIPMPGRETIATD